MAQSITSTRARFLLTTAAFLLLNIQAVRAQGGWGGGGRWGDNNGGDGWNGCGWWDGNDDCDDDDDDGDDGDDNENGTLDPAALGLSTSEINRTTKIITVHAVLASLVWVFLIPVGGILMRSGIKSPWILRIHAFLQSISYLIYIVAVGLGIYLVRSLSYGPYSMWSDPHTKLGIAILVLAFFQPILGLIHHSLYKRRVTAVKQGNTSKMPGRTAPGYAHLWLGRILIVLGMINGGLGLRLASNSPFEGNGKPKAIAYGVGAAVMFILYVAFVILGERRRTKERKEHQQDMSTRGVPLMTHDAEGVQRSGPVPPTYSHPPTYEDSQESLRKENATTARYS
ncbi:hypothetical protein OHC33_009175 [Knufia fluminis]|uniref:Cytochrome b561 domain-containing protein n=1 Tax=Knufia fluminis TaxID=191047 RepID=A0AAN8EM18_9EURO|nr:hypothetical protein OHC33_009175 [Knufia fluminis]